MPTHRPTATRRRLDRVLLVARRPTLRQALEECGQPHRPANVIYRDSLAAAREYLANHRVDAALVESQLIEELGKGLLCELAGRPGPTAIILLTDRADFGLAQRAMRAGADDVLVTPIRPTQLVSSVVDAVERSRRCTAHGDRVERLHRLCRKLNDARLDVSRQVDVLCNDLVNAYQALASQVQKATPTEQTYQERARGELDLEELLRLTLEHLMHLAGPSNAALYLPATPDEYSLGGYVNLDCPGGVVDLLLSSLADTLAPRVAEVDHLVHLTGQAEIRRWADRDADDLEGRHVAAVACDGEDECLAVIMLFRDGDTPFEPTALDAVSALAPVLGEALERIIRVHHRSTLHGPTDPFGADDLDLGYGEQELPF